MTETSKEIAIIEDDRPYLERVWDLSGRDTWEARTLEALQQSNQHKLIEAVMVLEWSDDLWTKAPGRRVRPTRSFTFEADIIDKHFDEEQTLIHHWRLMETR